MIAGGPYPFAPRAAVIIAGRQAVDLETGTVNGPMEINFPITVQGRIDPRHLSMDIGGGGPPIRVVTTNGPVSIRQE